MNFDPLAQAAVDLAKRAVPDGHKLDAMTLLAALVHGTGLRERYPQLARSLARPVERRKRTPAEVDVDETLQAALDELADAGRAVTADELAAALLENASVQHQLAAGGVGESEVASVVAGLGGGGSPEAPVAAPGWRGSHEREEALAALSSYGRVLTLTEPPHRGAVQMEKPLQSLIRTLCKMRRNNALILGQPGTGKSALVYELARRLVRGDPSLPPRIRDLDIFELSPAFLRSGAGVVGQYEERVKALIQTLTAHPKIVLFVDEIHSFLQSSMHERGPFSDANESFKAALGHGDFACIGCTTTAEYRFFMERDEALARRFSRIQLEPPTPGEAVRILEARLPAMAKYFDPLRIPDAILARTVELTEQYLPSRFQPDKSIQLLDEACAYCITAEPPLAEVTEAALWSGLEDIIGHSIARSGRITEGDLLAQLRAKIIGQDDALCAIVRAFVAGLGDWSKGSRPRGVYFFAGPTGVGKTETAVLLGKVLGGGRESLLRVDCNTLQGGHDAAPALHILLGPPPGYVGYVRGQGGLLSRVRNNPECVVLFDEIEKTHPGVGKLLLQVLDTGQVEDNDGNRLDFRRAYIVFTTNAGCTYDRQTAIGFDHSGETEPAAPTVDLEAVRADLRRVGFGEEFFGRIGHWFSFRALDKSAIAQVVQLQLERLRDIASQRRLQLDWDPGIVGRLSERWQPRFGVRHMASILRNRIEEQLGVAGAQGELKGVKKIHLRLLPSAGAEDPQGPVGLATRELRDDTLFVNLA
jgi:ATP-dependent Clp protease ATP-binding subunit ClpA